MTEKLTGSSGQVRYITVPVFAPREIELPPLKLSPYSVSTFRVCRQQYKFRYIDKLGDQYATARPYYTMANHVHATLRDLLSVVPIEERTKKTTERLLRKNWQRCRVGFKNRADEKRWAEKALAEFSRFVSEQDVAVHPLMLEAWVEAEITPGLILQGRIDRVDKEADGSLHIIDYKTGNVPQHTDWLQLYLYALIVSRKLPYSVHRVSFHYLSSGISQTAELNAEQLEQAAWDLLVIAGEIRREKAYRRTPGQACQRCDFTPICAGKQVACKASVEGDFELWRDCVSRDNALA